MEVRADRIRLYEIEKATAKRRQGVNLAVRNRDWPFTSDPLHVSYGLCSVKRCEHPPQSLKYQASYYAEEPWKPHGAVH